MLSVRIIPVLLLKGCGLVKGSHFEDHKYVGDPINAVKIFNDKGVDELIFLDISKSKEKKGPNYDLIKDIASQAFMPFGYGGGLSNVSDVERLFKIGVEKAILNTHAIQNPALITSASTLAGSQSIVVAIDVKRDWLGRCHVYTHSGTKNTQLDPVDVAKKMEDAGAGELMVTSIDREGTGEGYDLELLKKIASAVNIPVIASGGASQIKHFEQAVNVGCSAVAAGDMFVFYGKYKAVLINYPQLLKDFFTPTPTDSKPHGQ